MKTKKRKKQIKTSKTSMLLKEASIHSEAMPEWTWGKIKAGHGIEKEDE